MQFSGEKLKKLREERGLTRAQLAKAAPKEMTRQAVRNWEEGVAVPRTQSVLTLCRVLKVDVGFFFVENYYNSNKGA